MSTINLVITLSNSAAISSNIRVARIDNTTTPIYTTYANVTANPFILQNVDNGQYFVGATPNYPDGRSCPEVSRTTAPCTGINAFSAVVDGSDFVITYSAIASLPAVMVVVNYPNTAGFSNVYAATGVNITIPIPAGILGAYSIYIVPCCDVDTGFFGAQSAPVILNVT